MWLCGFSVVAATWTRQWLRVRVALRNASPLNLRLSIKAVSSRSRMEPEWINGKFEPRLILPLSLSYDHRLIDGADAARFLRWISEAFEQPFLLSVQG